MGPCAWAAISCAIQWLEVQETGSPEAKSLPETPAPRAVYMWWRLWPRQVQSIGCCWTQMQVEAPAEVDPSTGSTHPRTTTLFGSDLWGGGLVGIELWSSPTVTLPIRRASYPCKLSDDVAPSTAVLSANGASLAQRLERRRSSSYGVVLLGRSAAPPAVLWAP